MNRRLWHRVAVRRARVGCRRGQGQRACRIGPQKQIADRVAAPASHPALPQVSGQIVPEMAALAQRPEIGRIPVGRIMVEMGGCNHHPHQAQRSGIVRPRSLVRRAAPVAPDLAPRIEPAAVGQCVDQRAVRPVTGLAASSRATEPNGVAEQTPVGSVMTLQRGMDRHRRIVADQRIRRKSGLQRFLMDAERAASRALHS